jgi:LPXTG-motif cell wall-anchored protein
MILHPGFSPTEAQTLVEYSGLLASVAARISAIVDRAEWYVGQGNVKYILIGLLVILLLMLVRRRR